MANKKTAASNNSQEAFRVMTYRQLVWKRFKKHRLALVAGIVLIVMYTLAIFCEFVSPYGPSTRTPRYINAPPQRIHFFAENGFHLRPFVYGLKLHLDVEHFRRSYTEDRSRIYPIRFLVRGSKYKFWGLFQNNIHLFGVDKNLYGNREPGTIFLFGSDRLGRDLHSRTWYAARISLSIGLVGVAISFILGCILGGISGYYGGAADTIIQRAIEFLKSIPTIPFWMALSAALPPDWPMIKVYFGIVIILSLMGWCDLARVVRGRVLQLRDQDFITASRIAGGSDAWIISRHLLPSVMSYLIVSITLAIPAMILGETALSFLGLGIQAPAVSWGTLLQDAQKIRSLATQPWLLIPGLFIILAVMSYNFVGDGLRDAVDPHVR